eukprot:6200588-Pleurochrysis_carterae.AAC.2
MATMNVVCPQGAVPGQKIPIQTPDGRLFQVAVPAGINPGQQFSIRLPDAPSAPPVAVPMTAPTTATPVPTVHCQATRNWSVRSHINICHYDNRASARLSTASTFAADA